MAGTYLIPSLMRHRITIETRTTSRGDTGEVVDTWATFAIRWATVDPLVGREYFQALQEQSENMIKIRLRHDDKTSLINTHDYRILYKDEYLDIHSMVNPFQRNQEIILMCRQLNESR